MLVFRQQFWALFISYFPVLEDYMNAPHLLLPLLIHKKSIFYKDIPIMIYYYDNFAVRY